MSAIRLAPLADEDTRRWDDLIAPYRSRQLFHSRAWLDYLAASWGVTIRRWSMFEGERHVGYFSGGVLRKGPFRILGSPLRGWGTNFMGPVVDEGIDQTSLLEALDRLARDERLDMMELEHPMLRSEPLAAAGYQAESGCTYLVPLTPADPELMFQRIHPKKRNQVRKAMRSGLTIEDTDDPAVADQFYECFLELMRQKGLVPPYTREYPHLLIRHLRKADLLFCLRVRDAAGRILATGLFPHDDRTVYFWGGASWHDGRDLNPNDYLQWSLMRLAAERGLQTYNMCGGGRFKRGFGGELLQIHRWHKCYSRPVRWARRGYATYFQARLRLQARWTRPRSRPQES